MRRVLTVGILTAGLAMVMAPANASGVKVKPGTFVGTAADCGGAGFVDGTRTGVSAAWVTQTGLPDAGRSDHALVLEKTDPLNGCSAAGAAVEGVAGLAADSLGYDYRADSYCGAGAPRFNVVTSEGFHFVGGCANGTPTSIGNDRRGAAWNRVVFDLQNEAQTFPVASPTATLVSVTLIQDEPGRAVLDNISVNGGIVVGKPGSA